MIVYVVINKTMNDKFYIIGVYESSELALDEYRKYINNGQYTIIPMVLDQTVVNMEII